MGSESQTRLRDFHFHYCFNFTLHSSFCKVKVKSLSCVQLFATPWTVACKDPLSMGFSRQEYWSGCPFSSPGDLPNPGIEPRSPALQVDSFQLIHKGSSRMLEWVAYPFSRDLPHPRIEPVSSALHANSLPTKLSHNLSFV